MSDKTIIEGLQQLQADATVFYQKLRHYHWHVSGPQFFQLHGKFEELYNHWAEIIDELAERALTVGGQALPTLKEILSRATLKEDSEFPSAKDMMTRIEKDLEAILHEAGKVRELAEKHGDTGTVNMLDDLRDAEYKTLWMLRAFLK